MSSYYGGKPGAPFIIVKTFASIEEMATAFAQGPGYTAVNFDEYVLINTINKNNPENGQIFRRSFDFATTKKIKNYKEIISTDGKVYDETSIVSGGAVYVGTIVGPAGRAPLFNLSQYEALDKLRDIAEKTLTELELDNLENVQDTDILRVLNSSYQNGYNIYGDYLSRDYSCVKVMVDKNYRFYYCDNSLWDGDNNLSSGWYRIETAPYSGSDSYSIDNASLVPGVIYDGYETDDTGRKHLKPSHYHDTIDWRYISILNDNLSKSTAFVGFKFGVPVIEFEAEAVDAYYNRNDVENSLDYDNINLITPVSTDTVNEEGNPVKHPFYSKWDIKIPKGVKGDCISNIRVVPASAELMMLNLDENGNLVYNEDRTELSIVPYSDEDDITNSRMIIVADYTNYDRVPKGDTGTIFLGDYNMIDEITFTDDGTLTIDYSHDNTDEYPEWITWLTGLTLDKETGKWVTTFNNQTQDNAKDTEQFLTWVKKIEMNDEGSITYTHTTSDDDRTDEKVINWIKSFTFDKDSGKLTVTFNNDNLTDFEHTVNYIKDIELRATDNHILITHSDPEKGIQDIGSIQPIMAGPEDMDTTNLATHGLFFVETES